MTNAEPHAERFAGASVLVTGGSRGIGREIALTVARQGASRVAIGYLRSDSAAEETAAAIRECGAEPVLLRGNVGDTERLGEMLDEVDETLADITRDLRLRPKEDQYVAEEKPRTYSGCSAGERSGARWVQHDVVLEEATRDDDLGPVADRLVDAVPGWEVVRREEGVDSRGIREVDLELRSRASRTTFTVDISFWGAADRPDGVRFHITSGRTECVAVDAE
jgi:NAD(P)-dependent dehydrogenase (short-subunit alcohol dehydrogenase family)